MSNAFIVTMGISTVFIGLIAIIVICMIMGALCKSFAKEEKAQPVKSPATAKTPEVIANKQEIIAACCAAIAEELDTDVSGIKVVSFKRV